MAFLPVLGGEVGDTPLGALIKTEKQYPFLSITLLVRISRIRYLVSQKHLYASKRMHVWEYCDIVCANENI